MEGAFGQLETGVSLKHLSESCQALRSCNFILSLELFIVEIEQEFALRMLAWCMLVATWASMRVDDLQNVMPETVRQSNRGLTLRMARTKTTGGAKPHGPIPEDHSSASATVDRSLTPSIEI